jgi:hypothetical protein
MNLPNADFETLARYIAVFGIDDVPFKSIPKP